MKQRKSIEPADKDLFVQTVIERYQEDLTDRADWSAARLQRTAKLRGWLETKNYPWPDASNQYVPLLMSNSQRTQDTLHNAVMGTRPVMSAIAANKADADKGQEIDQLQDHQLFVEQPGEEKLGRLIQSFVDDGNFVAFIPWIKEKREVLETKPVPTPQDPALADQSYLQFLNQTFPGSFAEKTGDTNFTVRWTNEYYQPEKAKVEFYCDDEGRYFAEIKKDKVIFDGPCIIPKALEDVVVPSRAENLQPPTPSNPDGADHVMLVDYPSWDEINRLHDQGYYDCLSDEDLTELEERKDRDTSNYETAAGSDPEQHKMQKDAMAGMAHGNAKVVAKTFTRLTYFGRFDLDKDGFEEEIVARVLLESKKLCRLRHLQEEYPTPSPRRPFAEAKFMEVAGEFYGISQTELLEHLHDLIKVLLDQMIDKHTLSNSPWGVYRSASGVRPEIIRMAPGELYPVSNPQNDIVFPALPQGDQTVAINLIALISQWAERQSMQGGLQFGSVPQGKASALRTSTNMMSVLQQGDARPERILRRFFRGISQIYQQMHELNQAFLPAKKQYRVMGVVPQGKDPYREIESPTKISGEFQFDFKANALNTNKALTSQILSELAPALVNGMTLQLGLTDAEKIYNLLRDMVQSKGQDENKYLNAPPSANVPKLTAQDAMGQMVAGILPQGLPAEGAQMHLQSLLQFQQDPRYQELIATDAAFRLIFSTYLQQVQALVMQEQMQAMAAQQFAQALGGGGGTGGPQGSVDPGADQMSMQGPGQVNDESLPGAKGQVM